MTDKPDEKFYQRADAHIILSNDQLNAEDRGKVSASMMYATARFNAWISACGFTNAEEMQNTRSDTIKYFITEYQKMLEHNLDDYINNFDSYMKSKTDSP